MKKIITLSLFSICSLISFSTQCFNVKGTYQILDQNLRETKERAGKWVRQPRYQRSTNNTGTPYISLTNPSSSRFDLLCLDDRENQAFENLHLMATILDDLGVTIENQNVLENQNHAWRYYREVFTKSYTLKTNLQGLINAMETLESRCQTFNWDSLGAIQKILQDNLNEIKTLAGKWVRQPRYQRSTNNTGAPYINLSRPADSRFDLLRMDDKTNKAFEKLNLLGFILKTSFGVHFDYEDSNHPEFDRERLVAACDLLANITSLLNAMRTINNTATKHRIEAIIGQEAANKLEIRITKL